MSDVTSISGVRSREAVEKSPRGTGSADHPLVQLTVVRLKEFLREPEALFWVFIFPILLAAGLGIAFRNRPAEVLSIAVVSPDLAQSLRQEKLLDVEQLSTSAAGDALRTGKVALLVEPGANGSVVYHYDDTNPEGRAAKMLANFLIPGLLGMNLMGSAIWGMGFAIVDARRKKLMKRLVATPMPRPYYLLSFILSRLLLLVIEVVLLLGFGVIAFHVPVRGSLLDFSLLCVLGSLSFSALGLLISSRARTIEAASGLMNLVMLPMWIASGVFFSAQRFPAVVQPIIRALPLTAVIDALRANMLQGANLTQVGPELAILSAWMIVCFGLALKLFRWR